jgi:hypothetical protein
LVKEEEAELSLIKELMRKKKWFANEVWCQEYVFKAAS